MKAPFPWFGGKRRIAPEVWAAFGDVDNYVEPFAGSLAVLLQRPERHRGIATGAETVNDADRYLANFWRAVSVAPDDVARWADWPVNEADLFARHLWLVNAGRERIEAIDADPDFFDAKVAGWWVWGVNAWIGSGWCAGTGPWTVKDGRPHLGNAGQGVNRQRPHLGDAGRGVNRQRPHLGDAGRGPPHSPGDATEGGSGAKKARWDQSLWNRADGEPLVYGYMRALQARLRRVRVCCGDWSRVVTKGALSYGGKVGILLDPPYSTDHRTDKIYSTEDGDVSADVRAWAIEHGQDLRLRIALCGYEGEHKMPASWRVVAWKATGAYKGGGGKDCDAEVNRHRERIWFSPGCLDSAQPSLFGGTRG